jgi:hypothetical protein
MQLTPLKNNLICVIAFPIQMINNRIDSVKSLANINLNLLINI